MEKKQNMNLQGGDDEHDKYGNIGDVMKTEIVVKE